MKATCKYHCGGQFSTATALKAHLGYAYCEDVGRYLILSTYKSPWHRVGLWATLPDGRHFMVVPRDWLKVSHVAVALLEDGTLSVGEMRDRIEIASACV